MEAIKLHQELKNIILTDLSQKVILVVDDIQINYLLIKALLKQSGATVIWAETGYKALDLLDTGRKVDLVLMDYNMPGINGYETTKFIKSRRFDLPVISQTAYTFGPEYENIKEAYDDILLKPVTHSKLFDMIFKHI